MLYPKTVKMAVLLPMSAAIGSSNEIKKIKKEILRENTLEAVFSLPDEIFYPGASSVACCMVFTMGTRHDFKIPTFFGYYKDDGFSKKKNLGRVEKVDNDGLGEWETIKKEWLNLYKNRTAIPGKSTLKSITSEDEWLAEAYMETDYSNLGLNNFEETFRNYISYLITTKGE